jgi:energy-coupling factor transport system substrate-specific component
MSTQNTQKKKRGLASWSTRDLLVTAVIGIVFGLVVSGAMNLAIVLQAALTPLIGMILVMPVFVLAGVMAPYIIRKPGAAVISELVIGLVMVSFTPYGFAALWGGRLIEGVTYEVPFLVTRYRRWGWISMMLSPGLATTVSFTMAMFAYGGFNLEPGMIVLLYVGSFVAAAIGGALAKSLADAVAKTGVLASYAIGQQEEEI